MKKSTNLLIGILAAVFFSIVSAQSLRADTYTVTSTSLSGPGSFLEAVEMANSHPGPDVIEFTPGLQVDAAGDNPVSLNDYVIANITESVVIDGKGGALNGRQSWVTDDGVVNQLSGCPRAKDGTLILAVMPGFLSIGSLNQDNSDIEVTVKNLTIKQFNQVAKVNKNAALGLENFMAIQTWATHKCQGDALIEVDEGASLTILKSELNGFYNWTREGLASVIVGVNAGDLIIEESRFNRLEEGDNYLINWIGRPGSVVNIVSSRMPWSGGITIGGEVSHANIINSIWTTYYLMEPDYADRFRNVSTGDMNFIASTLVWNNFQCNGLCQSVPSYTLIERLGSGKINFMGTAIGFNFGVDPGNPLISTLGDAGTDGFTADEYTWIQPTEAQDADALKTITGQPALRTDLPAFKHPVVISTTEDFDLDLATPAFPGELIDKIPPGNPLINPITGFTIMVDVVGNDRVDANGDRDIGALQLGLAPNLVVSGTGDGSVDLSWNEPLHHDGLAINGYEVRYFLPGASSPAGAVGGISGLGVNVASLMNGTDYTFEVRAIYAGPQEGPWSNRVTATPYGALGTPAVTATAGYGEVALEWTKPELGGRTFSAYTILWRVAGTASYTGAQATYDYNQNFITITGLQNGTEYEFAVAVNAGGEVSAQGTATATPMLVPSTFLVTKAYSDSNTTPVEVTLACNGGLPLEQNFTIAPGSPVTFTLTDFIPGSVQCEVTESGGPGNYGPSYDNGTTISATSCVFDTVLSGGSYSCAITNSPATFDFVVDFDWDDTAAEATGSVDVNLYCTNVVDAMGVVNTSTQASPLNPYTATAATDDEFVWMDVGAANDDEDTDGKPLNPTTCWAMVPEGGIDDGAVEVTGCDPFTVKFGDAEANCTMTASVFFEGIPTLDRYGLALMALLMLGVGFVGYRRFA